jgi:hypothetical protein
MALHHALIAIRYWGGHEATQASYSSTQKEQS